MKKIFMLLFFILNINIFSYNYDDYSIFIQGKNAYEKEDYITAQESFETLMRSFGYSPILKNNYAFYFIGMTYYHLRDYEKAVYYLQKAVFTYNNSFLTKESKFEKNNYLAERDYSLGDALLKIGNFELGETYLQRLDYNYYSPKPSYFEKKALLLLMERKSGFEDYYNLKFNEDLKSADKLSDDKLLKVTEYFSSQKKFDKAIYLGKKILSSPSKDSEIKEKAIIEIFRSYLQEKKYKEIIDIANKYDKIVDSNILFFYKGVAYYKLKDFSRCLYFFESIKEGKYLPTALLYVSGIYYSFGDYNKVIESVNKISTKNIIADILLADSYLKLKKERKFEETARKIINNYPNSYEGLFFAFILENKNMDLASHNATFKISLIIDNFLNSTKSDTDNVFDKINYLELEKLCNISKIKNEELLKIELQNSSFVNKYSISNGLAVTTILENGEFYDLAYKNSSAYRKEFFKYRDLIKYNYPLYYKDIVDNCSKKYDIPQELIYTTMLLGSKFDKEAISKNSRIGLMMVSLKHEEEINELLKPEVNIELGSRKIKELLKKYNGNKLKTLIHYNFGEGVAKSIKFDFDGDINLDTISNPEEKYEIQDLIITYIFYKKLYNF
ncbi:transglycosylase SLT domain-containing protein [uncultured Fusobacterium sp.]|uniref:transglycosylase SLT domain-containing protein n=1 Tax=uncultured Fusobacterium sp. TaxID=159267 RepID=UPI0025D248E1|nr:transglycosylase SLT domain-containing protein [uncultured Fusobacterium sp.]